MTWSPTEPRDSFVREIMNGFASEEEWSRETGYEVLPCRPECDFSACTGWMKARPRALHTMYLEWSAEALLEDRGYRAPMLRERNR